MVQVAALQIQELNYLGLNRHWEQGFPLLPLSFTEKFRAAQRPRSTFDLVCQLQRVPGVNSIRAQGKLLLLPDG